MSENYPNQPEEVPEPLSNREIVLAVYRRVREAQANIDPEPFNDIRLSLLSGQLPPPEEFEAAIDSAQKNGAYEALFDLYIEINH